MLTYSTHLLNIIYHNLVSFKFITIVYIKYIQMFINIFTDIYLLKFKLDKVLKFK